MQRFLDVIESNHTINLRKNFEVMQKADDNDEVQKDINASFKLAISEHNIEAIKHILKCVHNPNLEQINKGELLLEAIKKISHEIVDLLLKNKFLPNDGNVHRILPSGVPYTVSILAEAVGKCGAYYRFAKSHNRLQKEKEEYQEKHVSLLKIIKSLLKAGAEPNRVDVMHRAVITEDLDMLKIILDSNSPTQSLDINLKNHNGDTILHKAVRCILPEMVEDILKRNIDLQQKNRDGETALQLAESQQSIVFDGEGWYSKECIESQEKIITLLQKAQNPKIKSNKHNKVNVNTINTQRASASDVHGRKLKSTIGIQKNPTYERERSKSDSNKTDNKVNFNTINTQRASVSDIHGRKLKSTIGIQKNPTYERERTKSDGNKTDSFKDIKESAHKIKRSNNVLMGVMLKSGFVLLCGLASISWPIITGKKEYFAVPIIIIIIAVFIFGINLYSYFNHSNEHYKKMSDVKISAINPNSKNH